MESPIQTIYDSEYRAKSNINSDTILSTDEISTWDDLEYAEEEEDASNMLSLDEIVQKSISKSVRGLHTFFSSNNFATEKGDQSTNLINVGEKKTYFLPPAYSEDFFTLMDVCRKEGRMVHYSERQETSLTGNSGIMIDFDRYQKTKDIALNERHFDALTRQISKLLREFIEFEEYAINGQFTFHMFYIRKPAIVRADDINAKTKTEPKYKDGFHILIPEIQVIKGFKRYLMSELVSRGILNAIFKDIDNMEPAEKMLDRNSAHVPVQFLGNSKPGKPAYNLTHSYEITFYADDDDIDRKLIDTAQLLAGEACLSRDGPPTPINLTYELALSTYMPIFAGRPTWLKKRHINYIPALETKIQILVEKSTGSIFSEEDLRRDDEDMSLVNINNPQAKYLLELLRILDVSYATSYELWFKVICAIAHCGISEDYKSVAKEFSKRNPESWSNAEFERVWGEATSTRFNKIPVTMRSIKHWAYTSSPVAYADVDRGHYGNILRRSSYENEGRVEQACVAKLSHAMCGDKFVVDVGYNEKTGKMGYCWFEFVTPGQSMRKGEVYKWRKELEPDNIHLFIGEHLPKVYNQVRDNIKDKKDNAQNEGEAKYWATVEKNFRLYQSKLGNDNFQNGAVRQSQYKFRQRGFYEELDSYEDVIGVGNGVLKLGIEPQLIKGFHEYKISKYTEVDYVPFDPENPRTKRLLAAYRDIFPEPDVFNFMMMHASTGLDRRESACLLLLLVGGGQNGKSFFAKMQHNTLGNMYCASGKSTLLTAPTERGESANSAQMQQKDKNYFYFDEFNKCEFLNVARIKSMVSPQWQSGRDLHTRQGNFKNTSNPICLSNFDFIIDTTDHGTWRRIYYYRNKVKFCKKPNPDNPFEKKVDDTLINQCTNDPLYLQSNLSILVHFQSMLWRDYQGDLKNIPVPTIDAETEAFRNRQDSLNKFITQMIVKSPNTEAIGLPTLAAKYIDWYNRNIKQTNQTALDVQAQLENSRIASCLEHRISGILFLVGHRLKSFPEEELQPDEEELSVNAKPAVIIDDTDDLDNLDDADDLNDLTDNIDLTDYITSERKFAVDPYLQELQRNAPNYIQSRTEKKDSEEDDNVINTFLGLI